MKKLLSVFTVIVLAFSACSSPSLDSLENSGTIEALSSLNFDWGDISIDAGDVEHRFNFVNSSDEDLLITGATTSCMCTTATIEVAGERSPVYGMHSNDDWSFIVEAGGEFDVNVVFDPMAHGPDAVGPLTRGIFLTSSSRDGELEMSVAANVMYDNDFQEKYEMEGFVFNEVEHDFGVVKQSSGINTYEFPFTYYGDTEVLVTGVPTSCACTTAEISQDSFKSGESGVVTVNFNPNLHEEPEGKFYKTITLLTDPELESEYELKIWAEMDMDLGYEYLSHPGHTDDEH